MSGSLVTDVTVGDRPGRAVHVVDGRIAWVGAVADAPAADRVLDGGGALLTPAFVDAHVHATATGLALSGLDLHAAHSLRDAVALLAAQTAAAPTGTVLGTGWDETDWPEGRGLTRADLDAVVGDRPAYLARVDVHSATVSTALLDRVPGITALAGYSPDGRLRLDAHSAARNAAYGSVPADQRRTAQRATLAAAAALGIGTVHEMAGPEVSSATDLAELLELVAGAPGPRVVGYWGELSERGGLDVVRELGLAGAGGDLFCDGALGSHTAALSQPYADRPETSGALRFELGSLVEHVRACTAAGLQAASTASATPPSTRCWPRSPPWPRSWGATPSGPPGTAWSTWRWSATRPSTSCAASAWWPACSPPSTPPGAGRPGCTPSGWVRTGRPRPTRWPTSWTPT